MIKLHHFKNIPWSYIKLKLQGYTYPAKNDYTETQNLFHSPSSSGKSFLVVLNDFHAFESLSIHRFHLPTHNIPVDESKKKE